MLQKKRSRLISRLILAIIFIFILMNIIAAFHAYRFTHFDVANTKNHKFLPHSIAERTSLIFFGVNNPRPENKAKPNVPYEVIKLHSNKEIEAWFIHAGHPKGTVILFHGYGGEKSSMLDKAGEFLGMGYNTFLVDFMGAGNSEGNQTTVGFKEGEEVKTCFDYLRERGEQNIILFGTSMGAVAILKAISDYHVHPQSIIMQSPFGTLYQTVRTRFDMMNIPAFPMAGLLVFWGGLENGFWAFGHNPVNYAKEVTCPALLMYGEQDIKVTRPEIDAIYKNLPKEKVLKIFPLGGHENLLKYKGDWENSVSSFLNKYNHSNNQAAKIN
jgi:alpha-beta hydrolase superfamily lysophospholipase